MRLIVLCCLLLLSGFAGAEKPPASNRERAIQITAELQIGGQRYDGRHITLWVPGDRIDEATARRFLAQLDRGVEVVRAHLGDNVDEPVNPRRLEMYVHPRVGMARVRPDFPTMIYIPTGRVLDGHAPYLHEIVHAVASWSWRHSEWLGEGLANHVAQAVEADSGGYHYSNVLPGRLDGLAEHLVSPEGREVLPLVGPRGRRSDYSPPLAALFARLMANRPVYAPPFYAQSWSFVDFLVERDGIDGLRAHVAAPEGTLDMEKLKKEWLAAQGVSTD